MTVTKCCLALTLCSLVQFAKADFKQDRQAILKMAGTFKIEFTFAETVPLAEGYELKKPYKANAHEMVKVAEDTSERIVLQHLLVVEDFSGPSVIKHWAQIWQYEDPRSLNFVGNKTWEVRDHSPEETKGTWTQFVTQVDDSPRYKARGHWVHDGNASAWTSAISTRPLPRRDYTKRKDYDLLVVTNCHMITSEGWAHAQDNRKLVTRDGQRKFLCVEKGLNHYRRVPKDKTPEIFAEADAYWKKTHHFWKDVRNSWLEVIAKSDKPISYARSIDGKRLGSLMGDFVDQIEEEEAKIPRADIDALISRFLR
jgi:hypothetical protein